MLNLYTSIRLHFQVVSTDVGRWDWDVMSVSSTSACSSCSYNTNSYLSRGRGISLVSSNFFSFSFSFSKKNILSSPNCVECPNAVESIRHALWDCPASHRIWRGVGRFVAIMPGARLNQVGKYMLAIMADPSWQIRASWGGDDFGDKSTRGCFLHHWKCPLNSS